MKKDTRHDNTLRKRTHGIPNIHSMETHLQIQRITLPSNVKALGWIHHFCTSFFFFQYFQSQRRPSSITICGKRKYKTCFVSIYVKPVTKPSKPPAARSGSRARTSASGSSLCSRRSTTPTRSSREMKLTTNQPLHQLPCLASGPSPSQFQTRARSTRPPHQPPQQGQSRCQTRVRPPRTPTGSSTLTLSIGPEAPAR